MHDAGSPTMALDGSAVWEDSLDADALERRNPTLARLRREYAHAERVLESEVRAQFPDLMLGPLFETDGGQERIGLLGALPLPLFDRNRRAIARAEAERALARAAYETTLEELLVQYALSEEQARAAEQRVAAIEADLLPIADRQLEDVLQRLRLGEGSTLVLLESLHRRHQVHLARIDALATASNARTEANRLLGPAPAGESEDSLETDDE